MYYFSYYSGIHTTVESFQFLGFVSLCFGGPKLASVKIVVSGAFANGFQNDSFPFSARDPVQLHPEMAWNTAMPLPLTRISTKDDPTSVPQPDLFCYYLDEPASLVWCVFGSTGFLSQKESNLNCAVLFINVSTMPHQHICPSFVSRFPLKRVILSYVLQLPEIFSFHLPELLQSEAGVFP